MKKGRCRLLVADPKELEIARQHYVDFYAHKIPELRQFLDKFVSDSANLSEASIECWLTENGVTDQGLKILLTQELKSTVDPAGSSKYERCKQIIRIRYQDALTEQYEPLIQASFYTDLNKDEKIKYQRGIENVVRNGLWINGKKILNQHAIQEEFLAVGLNNDTAIIFLKTHIARCCFKANIYFSKFLDDFQLLLGEDLKNCVSTYLEYDQNSRGIMLCIVHTYRDFHKLNSARKLQNFKGYHTQDNNSPIIAQSSINFRITQSESLVFNIEFVDGFLEIFDTKNEAILAECVARRCSGNIIFDSVSSPRISYIPDQIDGRVIERFEQDCLDLVNTEEILIKLQESNSALKIFLITRKNEDVLWEVIKSYELLTCLCVDLDGKKYLEMLILWHRKNQKLVAELKLLLDQLNIYCDDKLKGAKCIDLALRDLRAYAQQRQNAQLYIVVALHARGISTIPSLHLLMQDEEIAARLPTVWVVKMAIHSWDLSNWLVDSLATRNINIEATEFCKLLKCQPKLWNKIQFHPKHAVSSLLRQRLIPESFCYLLFENTDDDSLKCAKQALINDLELFEKLCELRNNYPNELLRYFALNLDFRSEWPDKYLQCERYLLSYCNESVIVNYYFHVFGVMGYEEFCDILSRIFVNHELLNGCEKSIAYAKSVWVRMLVRRCGKPDWNPSFLFNTADKMKNVISCMREEPRLSCLFENQYMTVNHLCSDENNLHEFISLSVNNYPQLDLNNVQYINLALQRYSLLDLTEFFKNPNNCQFFVNLLIKDINALDILVGADIEIDDITISTIFSYIPPQMLLLLMIKLHAVENNLVCKISQDIIIRKNELLEEKDRSVTFQENFIEMTPTDQLEYIRQFKDGLLKNSKLLEMLLRDETCSDMGLACLLFLEIKLSDRDANKFLDEKSRYRWESANDIVRSIQESNIAGFSDEAGINLVRLVEHVESLESGSLRCFLNALIFSAFADSKFAPVIITNSTLMNLLVCEADLILLVNFVCLFGKLNDFSIQWLPFFRRLVEQPLVYKQYSTLLNFHFRGAGNDALCLIKRSLELGCFNPQEYLHLILAEYSEVRAKWYREWLLRSDWLEMLISKAIPEELARVLIEEIRIRHNSDSVPPSAIEVRLKKEPVFTSLLRHSGSQCLLELIKIDSTVTTRVIECCRSTIMCSFNSELRDYVIQRADLEQLLYLIGDGNDHPIAIRSCLSALHNVFVADESGKTIALRPRTVVNLLEISERVDPNKSIRSEWGSLIADERCLCEFLINKNNSQTLVVSAVPVLWRYFPNLRASLKSYLKHNRLSYENLKYSDTDFVVEFLISDYFLVNVFNSTIDRYAKMKREADAKKGVQKLNLKIRLFFDIICQIFLSCNEQQLERFSILQFVKVFIQNVEKYISNHKFKQCVVVPRLVSALIFLSKSEFSYVEKELLENQFLFDLIIKSPAALSMLVSSSLYRKSEQIQKKVCNPREYYTAVAENSPPPLREHVNDRHGSDSLGSISRQVIRFQHGGVVTKTSSGSTHDSIEEASSESSFSM